MTSTDHALYRRGRYMYHAPFPCPRRLFHVIVGATVALAALGLTRPTLALAQAQAQAVTPAALVGVWAKQGQAAPYMHFKADRTLTIGTLAERWWWRLAGDTLVVDTVSGGPGLARMRRLVQVEGQQLTLTEPGDAPTARTYMRLASGPGAWALDQPLTGRALPCDHGTILYFNCHNVELLAYLPPSAIGGAGTYDIWGWTDSTTGREFAVVGGSRGTSFVEVTDPVNPKYFGTLPFHGNVHGKAGVKVYQHYAFIVVEEASAGLQVFDLAQLRDVKQAPATFTETAHYDGFGNAHTLTLNPATGFAYPTGLGGDGETCNSALYMLDVRTPTKPTFAGCYSAPGYIHDAQCVLYHGPDTRYQGREICLASGIPLKAVDIVDVTDKQHPQRLGKAEVPNAQIVHQGWLTEDQRYFFLDDEGNPTDKTRTIVFDLTRLDDPVLLTEFFNPNSDATAHNLYIRGKYMYQSNYTAGLRIVDISDPKHPHEVGYLDTEPYYAGPGQILGTWGNYPYFKHNVVAVASNGLFLVRLRQP